jgi:hypothetical protein
VYEISGGFVFLSAVHAVNPSFNNSIKPTMGLEMSETHSEKSEMANALEFCQSSLREQIAPRSRGSVKERIVYAARKTGFGFNRTKDIWYADERVSIGADEIKKIEHLAGVTHERTELRDLDDLIAKATILLDGDDARVHSAMACAFRAFLSHLAGA